MDNQTAIEQVCAWCSRVIRKGTSKKGMISHGICPACHKKIELQMQEARKQKKRVVSK